MDRRQFLTLSTTSGKTAKVQPARTLSGIAPYTGTWGTEQMVHLLKRSLFGATPADLNWCRGMSIEQAVDALLTNGPVPAPPVNNYGADATGVAPGATWVNSSRGDDELDRARTNSYKAWWLDVMINQSRSIQEKMVLFWHNHFVTEMDMVNNARYTYKYNTLLRQLGLGNFKDLTKAVSIDPAMLVYLNGNLNSKEAADENYARELHELFTVGKGPDSHYTEDDVRATARVLTGYRINDTTITSYFDSSKHDVAIKEFSSFYNNRKISGTAGPDGANELNELLDIIFIQPEVAKFICRKIYRFFVYYEIDDATEQNVIAPLADVFRSNQYNILPVLRTLFLSEHFFDPLNMACLIKSPVDFCVGMCREYAIQFPPASNYTARYDALHRMRERAASMLQDIGDPPLVAGWDAYHQEPQYHELWINTDTLPKRNQLSDTLISDAGYAGLHIDPIAFAKQMPTPSDPVALVNDSLDLLYRMGVSDTTKAFLKNNTLLFGQSPNSNYYWTDAWNDHINNPGDAGKRDIVHKLLQSLYKYIMNLSEYQLA